MKKPPMYFSYLLRLWRDNTHAPWRASLEDAHSGERQLFARPAELVKFLEEQMKEDEEGQNEAKGEALSPRGRG